MGGMLPSLGKYTKYFERDIMVETRILPFPWIPTAADAYVAPLGSLFFDPQGTSLHIGDGTTPGGTTVSVSGPAIVTLTYADQSQSGNDATGNIGDSGIAWYQAGAADMLYTVASDSTVTATGVLVMFYTPGGALPIPIAGLAATGSNGVRALSGLDDAAPFVAMAFATNGAGTAYSAPLLGTTRPLCLAAGTSIALADGNYKLIEDVSYADELLVWDFDNGLFAASKPLWIKKALATKEFNRLSFSDGSTLRTVGQHRIFNAEAGAFTYPMTEDTPIGTTTCNQFGRPVTLVAKEVVEEPTTSHNVITDYHMNLFADGILTSNRYNNLYPIAEMKFVKDRRSLRTVADMPERFHHGLRLAEQTIEAGEIARYIARLQAIEVRESHDRPEATLLTQP